MFQGRYKVLRELVDMKRPKARKKRLQSDRRIWKRSQISATGFSVATKPEKASHISVNGYCRHLVIRIGGVLAEPNENLEDSTRRGSECILMLNCIPRYHLEKGKKDCELIWKKLETQHNLYEKIFLLN